MSVDEEDSSPEEQAAARKMQEFPVAASEWSYVDYEPSSVRIFEKDWRDYVVYYTARAGLDPAGFQPPLFLRALSRGMPPHCTPSRALFFSYRFLSHFFGRLLRVSTVCVLDFYCLEEV